jgi:hypothetical protein
MRRRPSWIALIVGGLLAIFCAQLKLAATSAESEVAALKRGATSAEQREPPVPKELLERVAAWAERFLVEYGNYAAVETLEQTRWEGKRRTEVRQQIVSDYLVARLPENPRELAEFRDVVSVDGKEKLAPEERAAKWKKLVAAQSRSEIAPLVEDPAKYRSSSEHFVNLGLLVSRLAERHHEKMRYFFAQDTSDGALRHALVGYRQVSGPGLIKVEKKAVYPAGQAWVQPDDGHIERIEEEFTMGNMRYAVAVDYAKSEEMGAWVTETVTVRIFEKGRLVLQNIYGYSNFRKFGR